MITLLYIVILLVLSLMVTFRNGLQPVYLYKRVYDNVIFLSELISFFPKNKKTIHSDIGFHRQLSQIILPQLPFG